MLTDEQIEWRRTCIGGSDAAALHGLSPWKSPVELWLEKRGLHKDNKTSVRLEMGSFLEPLVRSLVMRGMVKTHGDHWALKRIAEGKMALGEPLEMARSEIVPCMGANTDGTIGGVTMADSRRESGRRWLPEGILEIKTAGEMAFKRAWSNGVPLYYQAQCQHYMFVTEAQFAIVACLELGGTVHCYLVERDEIWLQTKHVPACQEFWAQVQSGEMPPVDDSDSCARALSIMFPEPEPGKVADLGDDADRIHAIANEFQLCAEQIRELTKTKKGYANELAAAFGDAQEAHMQDGTIIKKQRSGKGWTYKVREPRGVVA